MSKRDRVSAPIIDFSCALRSREFEDYTRRYGYIPGRTAIVLSPDDEWGRALEVAPDLEPPLFVARQNIAFPYGWELRLLGPADEEQP